MNHGWAILPDRPVSERVIAHLPPGEIFRHASGRPWIIGDVRSERLVLAADGPRQVAFIGSCGLTQDALLRALASLRSVEQLDDLAATTAGCWHLVASLDGVVRAQGSLSGLRRIFHANGDGLTIAADRADTVAAATRAAVDEEALAVRVACGGWEEPPVSERTYWDGVEPLESGSYLLLERDGRAADVAWWRPPEPRRSLADGAAVLGTALQAATSARAPSAGRLSSDLSGGVDSTSLCFLAADYVGPELLTYRWSEAEAGNEDARFAAHAAELLPDAEHVEADQAELPLLFTRPESLGDSEAPYPFGRTLERTRHDASLLAKLGSTVHLAGHGGDELFSNVSATYLHTLLRRHPLMALRRIRIHLIAARWPRLATARLLLGRNSLGGWWRRQADELTARRRGQVTGPQLDWSEPITAPSWVTPTALDAAREVLRRTAESVAPLADDRGQHVTMATVRKTGPLYRQLAKVYRDAGVSLEVPYFDDRVLEATLSVRVHERTTPWEYKPLLRTATRGLVPTSVANRGTKSLFDEDLRIGLRRNRADILSVFADSSLAAAGLIDVDDLRRTLLSPHASWEPVIALEDLLGCEMWLRGAQSSMEKRSY